MIAHAKPRPGRGRVAKGGKPRRGSGRRRGGMGIWKFEMRKLERVTLLRSVSVNLAELRRAPGTGGAPATGGTAVAGRWDGFSSKRCGLCGLGVRNGFRGVDLKKEGEWLTSNTFQGIL